MMLMIIVTLIATKNGAAPTPLGSIVCRCHNDDDDDDDCDQFHFILMTMMMTKIMTMMMIMVIMMMMMMMERQTSCLAAMHGNNFSQDRLFAGSSLSCHYRSRLMMAMTVTIIMMMMFRMSENESNENQLVGYWNLRNTVYTNREIQVAESKK